ncbi:hypothetical protein TSOC_014458 [Tetrabaena socialis]|uniref:Uncharacterized protein n=1 Tax=Tetrabaena socialis TaxID=47790 RepID=A0A2J7ZHQ7_9CHLO|nr:hypothetical protein TSOC_014458 [Tetrabaena socialis]|eukprot:PNG99759.1 hypothetical protein TSOC_014458 [Tetrabaena socialis]
MPNAQVLFLGNAASSVAAVRQLLDKGRGGGADVGGIGAPGAADGGGGGGGGGWATVVAILVFAAFQCYFLCSSSSTLSLQQVCSTAMSTAAVAGYSPARQVAILCGLPTAGCFSCVVRMLIVFAAIAGVWAMLKNLCGSPAGSL